MKKLTAFIAAATFASFTLAHNFGAPTTSSTATATTSVSIGVNATGSASAVSRMDVTSSANTVDHTLSGPNGVGVEVTGRSKSTIDGYSGAWTNGSAGLSASAVNSGASNVDLSRSHSQETLFGDRLFDYEAANASVTVGTSVSGSNVANVENVYGADVNYAGHAGVGESTANAGASADTFGKGDVDSAASVHTTSAGDTDAVVDRPGANDFANGTLDVDANADADSHARN